ncbi:hypothetical protein GWG65_16895 [Bradyrhizobium sp. CSA207]|uniref:hypothetical protein n=1 Tax=Bradyrhizobium sp. CSA207 TaxID=2698826 RepID=UPI0023AE7C56|nr:hypothetical protein [Bradyrhizobium sp. CSA207]MDE5443103.1 hypothetical protein [Bradyrhizobium sp. CSA207]
MWAAIFAADDDALIRSHRASALTEGTMAGGAVLDRRGSLQGFALQGFGRLVAS